MKKTKKMLALLAALALLLALAGCGSSAGGMAASTVAMAPSAPAESSGPMGWANDSALPEAQEDAAEVEKSLAAGRKIVYTAFLELETTHYQETCADLMEAVKKAGGYVEQSSQSGSEERGGRWCEYVFRIPSGKYSEFLTNAENAGNPVYKNEDARDVTSTYVDLEARVSSLESQRDRLLELQAKAENLEDLLAIENQLTQVQYQLESYAGQKKALEDQIDSSTVTVSVREVRVLTPVETSFGARLSAAFVSGWNDFGDELQDIAVNAAENLPWLIVGALIIAAVLAGLRKRKAGRMPRTKKDWFEKVLKKVSVEEPQNDQGGNRE